MIVLSKLNSNIKSIKLNKTDYFRHIQRLFTKPTTDHSIKQRNERLENLAHRVVDGARLERHGGMSLKPVNTHPQTIRLTVSWGGSSLKPLSDQGIKCERSNTKKGPTIVKKKIQRRIQIVESEDEIEDLDEIEVVRSSAVESSKPRRKGIIHDDDDDKDEVVIVLAKAPKPKSRRCKYTAFLSDGGDSEWDSQRASRGEVLILRSIQNYFDSEVDF
ncbi:hypothetical protein DFH28DRAFT_925253 [Melampsora americana]|nr:hypothetical protein DFH28DRAFT_925253 [Melampsora americana]